MSIEKNKMERIFNNIRRQAAQNILSNVQEDALDVSFK